MVAWIDNHELAEAECRRGWSFEDKVADRLRQGGLRVDQPPKNWRDHVDDRHEYTNELDLLVEGLRMSVKSRRVAFSCPEDIPDNRNPLFVDTLRKWDLRDPEPAAVICISQETDAIIWTSTHPDAKARWGRRGAYDAARGYSDQFMTADKSMWYPIETLIDICLDRRER